MEQWFKIRKHISFVSTKICCIVTQVLHVAYIVTQVVFWLQPGLEKERWVFKCAVTVSTRVCIWVSGIQEWTLI